MMRECPPPRAITTRCWHTPFEATKRVVGSIIILLAATLLLPLPFSHIIPPLVIMLISFAYLEDEGMLLCISCRCPRLLRDHCCDGLGDGLLEKLLWGM
jgi:hypothetical protein